MKKSWIVSFLVMCLVFMGMAFSASAMQVSDVSVYSDLSHISPGDGWGYDYVISSPGVVADVGLQRETTIVYASKSLEKGSSIDYVANGKKNDLHNISVFLALLE